MTDYIPEGWSQVLFGDVVNLSKAKTKDPADDGIERFIGLEHIEAYDLKVRTWGSTSDGTSFTNLCSPGQILFGKRRPYLRKLAVADFPAVCSGDIYIFEPLNEAIDSDYLTYVCFSDSFFEYAIQTSAGSLSPRTNWKHISKYEFVLPPIEIQKRIVKVVEAVNDHLDAIENALEKTRSARLSTLSKLLSSSNELWMETTLKDLTSLSISGVWGSDPGEEQLDVPVYRQTEFDDFGHLAQPAGAIRSFNEKKLLSRTLKRGDVLIQKAAGTPTLPGRVVRVPYLSETSTFSNFLGLLRADESIVLPDYYFLILQFFWQSGVAFKFQRGTNIRNLDLKSYLKLPILIPSLSEQKWVVDSLGSIDDQVAGFLLQIELLQQLRQMLLSELLTGTRHIPDSFDALEISA